VKTGCIGYPFEDNTAGGNEELHINVAGLKLDGGLIRERGYLGVRLECRHRCGGRARPKQGKLPPLLIKGLGIDIKLIHIKSDIHKSAPEISESYKAMGIEATDHLWTVRFQHPNGISDSDSSFNAYVR